MGSSGQVVGLGRGYHGNNFIWRQGVKEDRGGDEDVVDGKVISGVELENEEFISSIFFIK